MRVRAYWCACVRACVCVFMCVECVCLVYNNKHSRNGILLYNFLTISFFFSVSVTINPEVYQVSGYYIIHWSWKYDTMHVFFKSYNQDSFALRINRKNIDSKTYIVRNCVVKDVQLSSAIQIVLFKPTDLYYNTWL